jgi:mannosyltransferase
VAERDSPPVLARASGPATGEDTGSAARGGGAGPVWMRVLPSLVMAALGLWRITGPSYWRDEAATLTAVGRPLGQLVRMLGHVDAVHGVYYLVMWPLVRVAGSGEVVTRLPSVLAMAVAAGLVAALGRRLVSPGAGLAAGLIFAFLPQVSLYGQDARSYAMVTALGAAASYLLVRAISAARGSRDGGGWRDSRRWLAGYAACLAAMGALNIFGLLLIAAHGVTVAITCLLRRNAARSFAVAWLAVAAAVVLLVSPVLALAFDQRSTVSWITPPDAVTFTTWWRLVGPGGMVLAICAACGCGLVASALAGRAALRASWPPMLAALALPWLVLPPAILIGVSFARPLYVPRYLLYCLPAVALLAGAALAALAALGRAVRAGLRRAAHRDLALAGGAVATAVLAVIVLLGLGTQVKVRSPAGHNDNIRHADRIIAARMRPGDAVLSETSAPIWAAYPYGLARLPDIARHQAPVRSATLDGTVLPTAVVRARIAGVSRLWVVEVRHRSPVAALNGLGLRLAGHWRAAGLRLLLYEHPGQRAGADD